jgi:hypothetical protein
MNKEVFERKWKEIAKKSNGYVDAEITLNDGNVIYSDNYNFINGKLELYFEGWYIATVNVSTVKSINQYYPIEGNLNE